jgi:hypothetical protein
MSDHAGEDLGCAEQDKGVKRSSDLDSHFERWQMGIFGKTNCSLSLRDEKLVKLLGAEKWNQEASEAISALLAVGTQIDPLGRKGGRKGERRAVSASLTPPRSCAAPG